MCCNRLEQCYTLVPINNLQGNKLELTALHYLSVTRLKKEIARPTHSTRCKKVISYIIKINYQKNS